ncbi:MAG TPA: hypothetical protein VN181_14085, partial [Thermoanaerobaculia bacterium]|nr:hypothetical protein [Thermoanaerobaculia bacterium]
ETPHPDILAILPAGWILSDRPLGAPMQGVARARGVLVYRDPVALPMATFWSRAIAAPSNEAAFRALMQHAGGGLRVTPHVDASIARAPQEIVAARIEELASSRVRIVVDAPRDGIVVLSQQDAPGWRVRVDGVAREKLVAHGIFRAVMVRAGHHEVIWTYRPRTLFIGAWMTFITLVSLQLRVFVKRAR